MRTKKLKWGNPLFVLFLAVAGIFGVSSALVNKQVNDNQIVEKAEATTDNAAVIDIQVVDAHTQTGENHDLWIHCWDLTFDSEYSIFTTAEDAYNAGALTSYGVSYDSTISQYVLNFAGSFAWWYGIPNSGYTEQNYRSYHFVFPWFITGLSYTINFNSVSAQENYSMIARCGVNKSFFATGNSLSSWDNSTWSTDNYSSDAYTMTFDTNGGTEVPDNPYVFKKYQKTLAPGVEDQPTKYFKTFSKWTETNDPSADAFSFGSNLTEDIVLYAQYVPKASERIVMWTGMTHAYLWNRSGGQDTPEVDWPGKSGSTMTIGGVDYYYCSVGADANYVIFSNNGGSQTADLPIPSGALDGQYYDCGAGSWKYIMINLVYKDKDGEDYSGTESRDSNFKYGETYSIENGSKSGFKFMGWHLESDCSDEVVTSLIKYGYDSTVTLYADWEDGRDGFLTFVTGFNTSIGGTCQNDGSTNKTLLKSAWSTQSTNYLSDLEDSERYWLNHVNDTGAFTDSQKITINTMLGKYDYVYSKYASDGLNNFLGRSVSAVSSAGSFSPFSLFNGEDNLSTIIIIVASSIALVSIGALSILIIKKRKTKEE